VVCINRFDLLQIFLVHPSHATRPCRTIRKGTKAPGAAGIIHTDFEKGFICADVMAYTSFKEYVPSMCLRLYLTDFRLGSIAAVKAAGKFMQKGREYVVLDGDIIEFKVLVRPCHPAR
jgi:obg-like ATPase 1